MKNSAINTLLEFSGFVSVTASDSTSMTLAWTQAQDSTTTAAQMNYQIYVSTAPSFTPSSSNLNQTVTGVSAAKISGLIPATTYYTQVVAVDQQSLASTSGVANSWTTAQASGINPLIQGRIYPSLSNYAYQAPVIPDGGIVGAITTSANAVSSDATGQFQISSSGTGNDAFPGITVNASGFQKAWTTIVEATDNGTAQVVGLYPSTTVKSRPGFVKGVFTFDSGGFRNDMYLQGLFDSTYARIQNQVGANLVAISDPVFVNAYDTVAGTVTMSTMDSPGDVTNGMLTQAQYTVLVNDAHSRNMAFMLQLGVTPGAMSIGGTQTVMPWSVSTQNTAFWSAWFDAYKTVVVQYATIAKNLNIEYLSLGMNEGFMTGLPVSYWTPLISAIRSTGYSGKLVYQAMSNPEVKYLEVSGFNQQQPQAFVNLFDAIVLDVYNIGLGKTSPLNISRDDIKTSFQWMLGQVQIYNVPIFIMLGTPSVYGGAVNPQYVEPCLACNSIAPTLQRDFMQQADVYQALAEVVNATPTGAGNVMGILSWGYSFSDDYLSWTPVSGPAYAFAFDKSANVRGKPSEAVLNWWFTQW